MVAAQLFFGSLLAHELSHALLARRAGLEVERITLARPSGGRFRGGQAGAPPRRAWPNGHASCLLCADGTTNTAVAAELAINRDTVGRWRNRFAASGSRA